MDGKDNLSWRHSALARPSRVEVMRGMFPILQPDVLNNRAMESSLNGCTAGGCVRKTIKLKVKHNDLHVSQHFLPHFHITTHRMKAQGARTCAHTHKTPLFCPITSGLVKIQP